MKISELAYAKKVELLTRAQIIVHLKTDFLFMDLKEFSKQTKDCTNLERFVYLVLYRFRNKKSNTAFPSLETLSECISTKDTPIHIQSISRVIKGLVAKGLIQSEAAHDNASAKKIFRFTNPLPEIEGGFKDKLAYDLLLNKSIEWQDRLFLIQIYPYIYSAENVIKYTKKQMSDMLGISLPTVMERVKSLSELGILTRKQGVEHFKVNLAVALDLDELELDWFIRKILDEGHTLRTENEKLVVRIDSLEKVANSRMESVEQLKEENETLKNLLKKVKGERYDLSVRVAKLESEIRERNHVDRFAAKQAKNKQYEAHKYAFDESEFEE